MNQKEFKHTPNAASLKKIMGKNFDLDEVFYSLVENIKRRLDEPILALESELYTKYHSKLYKINEQSEFIDQENNSIIGKIEGISVSGKLKVRSDDGNLQEFGLKEIKLKY